jgi:hypothetical protein
VKFYDEHAEQRDRFAIVAFHDTRAKTFEELDAKMAAKGIVEKRWKGRPLPFATLLDATGETLKTYEIKAFPTVVLIDPEGTVVQIGGHKEAEAHLKKVLDGKNGQGE